MRIQDNIDPIVSIAADGRQVIARRLSATCVLAVRHLVFWLKQRHEVRRSRRALERLSAYELRDIGLSRHQARAEYRKSFYLD